MGGFLLLVDTRRSAAELMAECARCGAMTTYALELASQLRTVTCRQCLLSTRLRLEDLVALRAQLIEARVRIDRLIFPKEGGGPSPAVDGAGQ
jgi:late competence protein required for DNA uptake (superfamily II DNA/RNA helicase)